MLKKFCLGLFLVLLASSAFAFTNVYWLRGTDVKTTIEGEENFFMSSSFPNSSSTKTEVSIKTVEGEGEIARWYSVSFLQDYVLDGNVFVWVNNLKTSSPSNQFRFGLHAFDFSNNESEKIIESEWQTFPLSNEFIASISSPYILHSGKRLKLLLEYNSSTSNSDIGLVLDEGNSLSQSTWNVSSGQSFDIFGVDSTAGLLLEFCSPSGIICEKNEDCVQDDSIAQATCINAGGCNSKCIFEECDTECILKA
ncbi:unnamed protein product, partial [marine sediment metagenome]